MFSCETPLHCIEEEEELNFVTEHGKRLLCAAPWKSIEEMMYSSVLLGDTLGLHRSRFQVCDQAQEETSVCGYSGCDELRYSLVKCPGTAQKKISGLSRRPMQPMKQCCDFGQKQDGHRQADR